jgi:hypothetical protein
MNAKTHKALGLLGGAAALIVALGWGVNAGGHGAVAQAAPDAPGTESPAPPPAPPPPTYDPRLDYWSGQGSAGGAPAGGAGGGAGGGGGGGGGGG